jgi:hypothetical protein
VRLLAVSVVLSLGVACELSVVNCQWRCVLCRGRGRRCSEQWALRLRPERRSTPRTRPLERGVPVGRATPSRVGSPESVATGDGLEGADRTGACRRVSVCRLHSAGRGHPLTVTRAQCVSSVSVRLRVQRAPKAIGLALGYCISAACSRAYWSTALCVDHTRCGHKGPTRLSYCAFELVRRSTCTSKIQDESVLSAIWHCSLGFLANRNFYIKNK